MADNFVTLDIKTYQSLQEELQALRQQVVSLLQAKLTEPFGIARQRTLFNVIGTIRASLDLNTIFQGTAREVRQLLNVDRVGIFQFDIDSGYNDGEFISEDVGEGYKSALDTKVHDHCFGEKYATYYQEGKIQAIADIYNAGLSECHIEILSGFQVKANLIVPLVCQEKLWGLLCIHQCSSPRNWENEEIDFSLQIAAHLDIAIQQAYLLSDTQEKTAELELLNQQLEEKINQRTTELINLNQTLEKRVEERTSLLEESEARFQKLASNIPGVICQLRFASDGSRSFPYVSPGCRKLLELEPDQFFKCFELVHPEDRQEIEEKLVTSAQNLARFEWEWRMITPSGQLKWIHAISHPEKQPDEAIIWDGLLIDVTDRKQAEANLQISEKRFRLVAEQTGQLIYDYDMTSDQIDWSGAIEKITSYTPNEFKQFDLEAWKQHLHPDDRQLVLELLEQSMKNGTQYYAEYRLKQKDDIYIYVEDNGAFLSKENGELYRMVGTISNITQRKQAEIILTQQKQDLENALRELQQTQTQLVQSEKMSSLGQLVAGVAHEINNPVNFIYGNLAHANHYAESLLNVIATYQKCYPNPAWEVREATEAADLDFLIQDFPKLLRSIQVGAERIREIIAALRNFSRIDEAECKLVDIHDGIDSTLMILHNRIKPSCDFLGIKVIKDYGTLPPVECYAGQLNQVFMNILGNAIDALEERDKQRTDAEIKQNPSIIRITTESVTSTQTVKIKISDNGPGIPEQLISRIFDPFFTTKPIGKGTGLGMSISYQIITEKHHGKIECFSSPEKGAEFAIELPISLIRS